MKHCVSVDQFDPETLGQILNLAKYMEDHSPNILSQKVITNLFYEPSTRTSSSFYAAASVLGGSVIQINNVQYSSVAKGETLEDTIMTMAQYSDCIVLRHPDIGSSRLAASVSPVPIINAGDGSGEHPTQALLDFYTIVKKYDLYRYLDRPQTQKWKSLNVGLMGDLKYGRTVHSLKKFLDLYGISTFLISPESLQLPDEYLNGNEYIQENLDGLIDKLDVLYLTRVQKERMAEGEQNQSYRITIDQVDGMKDSAIIMHPLPRNDELPTDIDSNHRAEYFQQMKNGLYVRKALYGFLLGV